MLLQFYVKNYRSILDPVMFSMLADTDLSNKKRHTQELIQTSAGEVLPVALIYGANGSGKTNLLRAMLYLRHLAISMPSAEQSYLDAETHKLASENETTVFEIYFMKDDTMFCYYLEFSRNGIILEELYYYPNKRKAKVFERNDMEVKVGSKFKASDIANGKNALTRFRTLLACVGQFDRNNKIVGKAYHWFKNDLTIIFAQTDPDFGFYTKRALLDNEENKQLMVGALNSFGIPVKNLKVEKQKVKLSPEMFPADILTEEFRKELSKNNETIRITLQYEDFEIDLDEESNGIKKLLYLFGPLIHVLQEGKTLVYDELETSLHEFFLVQLIKLFQKYGSQTKAQLIFSTHDTGPLDLKLLRKDQIWFTELINEKRVTDLYSLLEIKDVRPDENILNGYLKGKYGAIPCLND